MTSSALSVPQEILVVDDEEEIRHAIRSILEREGYRVTDAENGRVADEKFRSRPFDLVISDVRMAEMGGVELTHSIKKQRPVPVILITGFGDSELTRGQDGFGPDTLLSKPFTRGDLLKAVKTNLRATGQQIGVAAPKSSENTRFRKVAEAISEGFRITSADGAVLEYASPANEQIYGTPLARFQEKPMLWTDLIHPEDREEVLRELEAWRKSGFADPDYNQQYRITRADGGVRWLRDRAYPLFSPDGAANRIVWVTTDITRFKQPDARNSSSDQDFRIIFDTCPIGILLGDGPGGSRIVNPALLKMTGYTHEEFGSLELDQLVHPDDFQEVERLRNRLREGRTDEFTVEYRLLRKSGGYFWAQDTARAVRDSSGRLVSSITLIEDVERRKLSEEQHRKTEARFRGLFEFAPGGILVADRQGRILQVNATLLSLLGYTREEVQTLGIPQLLHPEDRATALENICEILHGHREVIRLESRVIRKDGAIFCAQVTLSAVRDELGHAGSLALNIEDISERRRSEALVNESVTRFHQLAETIDQAFWIFDIRSQRMVYLSPAYERIFGLKPEASLANPLAFLDAVHPEDRARVQRSVSHPITGVVSDQYRVVHGSSEVRWIDAKKFPVRDEKGAIHRIVGVAKDVTEQRITEQKAVLASRMSSLGEMAAGIAHEINNPLAIISVNAGHLQALADEGNLDQKTLTTALDQIERTTLRISKIVKGLRTFARQGEKDPFLKTEVSALLTDVLELCQDRFHDRKVRLEVVAFSPLLSLECRATQLGQVLLNLLGNALDAASSGARSAEKWVSVATEEAETEIRIVISDSGDGVPEKIRDKLTEPFFTTKPVGQGTGLGLSISKGLVEDHGGSLEFDWSSPHTRVVITLPRTQPGRLASTP